MHCTATTVSFPAQLLLTDYYTAWHHTAVCRVALRYCMLRSGLVCGVVWCVLSSPRSAAALMNRMPNGHEMLTPDTSPDATAPFRGPYEGEIWYNKNLAATFREVAANGKDGYYKGRIAKEIVKVLGDMGGVMTEEDLANHYVRYVLHAARCTLHAARCTLQHVAPGRALRNHYAHTKRAHTCLPASAAVG
jgi:hypothetical protein